MFDDISFIEMNRSILSQLTRYYGSHEVDDSFPSMKDYYQNNPDKVSYLLDGIGKYLYVPPVNIDEQSGLLHMQTFGLLDAGSKYYTERKEYASWLLLYTYNGAGMLEYNDNRYKLEQGDGFLIDCTIPQKYYTCGKRWYHSTLHFTGLPAQNLYAHFYKDHIPVFHIKNRNLYQTDLEKVLKVSQGTELFRAEELSILLQQLILDILKEKYHGSDIPDFISAAKNYLDANYSFKITLDDLAKNVNVSKYYLSREFKKHMGLSISEYLIQLRMNQAQTLLLSTSLSIQLIAQLTGFSNYSNFYKLFCKKFNTSPAKYRESNS